jgi:hypothetical protein
MIIKQLVAVVSKSQEVNQHNQQEIFAFVVLNDDYDSDLPNLKEELKTHVIKKIGEFNYFNKWVKKKRIVLNFDNGDRQFNFPNPITIKKLGF